MKTYQTYYATKDNAPSEVPHYEATFVRAENKKSAKAQAEQQISASHKQWVSVVEIYAR